MYWSKFSLDSNFHLPTNNWDAMMSKVQTTEPSYTIQRTMRTLSQSYNELCVLVRKVYTETLLAVRRSYVRTYVRVGTLPQPLSVVVLQHISPVLFLLFGLSCTVQLIVTVNSWRQTAGTVDCLLKPIS